MKGSKEMRRRRAMNKLPRHVKRNLLMQENVPRIHPSEVKDILKE